MKKNISIVLTATIIPNAIKTEYQDFMQRRGEYLKAIDYYQQYGTVYFLENSSYDLLSDKEFFKYKNVYIRKFPQSKYINKGKGYQEFEMLDNWLNSEALVPERWIKISGRYLINNFDMIFTECLSENKYGIVIEQRLRPSVALTDIFYVATDFYRRQLLGAYMLSDDAVNVYIEHVVRLKLKYSKECRVFHEMPLITGISGSTGQLLALTFFKRFRRGIGKLTYIFNKKYRII